MLGIAESPHLWLLSSDGTIVYFLFGYQTNEAPLTNEDLPHPIAMGAVVTQSETKVVLSDWDGLAAQTTWC
jgi:hypothetical protein